MEATDVVVVGAGPSGLAVGACLQERQINFIILEREQQVGSSWRKHYERLHLHTIKSRSSLPFRSFNRNYLRYVSRSEHASVKMCASRETRGCCEPICRRSPTGDAATRDAVQRDTVTLFRIRTVIGQLGGLHQICYFLTRLFAISSSYGSPGSKHFTTLLLFSVIKRVSAIRT